MNDLKREFAVDRLQGYLDVACKEIERLRAYLKDYGDIQADLTAAERYIKNRDIRITKIDDELLAAREENRKLEIELGQARAGESQATYMLGKVREEVEALKAERAELRGLLEYAGDWCKKDENRILESYDQIKTVEDAAHYLRSIRHSLIKLNLYIVRGIEKATILEGDTAFPNECDTLEEIGIVDDMREGDTDGD